MYSGEIGVKNDCTEGPERAQPSIQRHPPYRWRSSLPTQLSMARMKSLPDRSGRHGSGWHDGDLRGKGKRPRRRLIHRHPARLPSKNLFCRFGPILMETAGRVWWWRRTRTKSKSLKTSGTPPSRRSRPTQARDSGWVWPWGTWIRMAIKTCSLPTSAHPSRTTFSRGTSRTISGWNPNGSCYATTATLSSPMPRKPMGCGSMDLPGEPSSKTST